MIPKFIIQKAKFESNLQKTIKRKVEQQVDLINIKLSKKVTTPRKIKSVLKGEAFASQTKVASKSKFSNLKVNHAGRHWPYGNTSSPKQNHSEMG